MLFTEEDKTFIKIFVPDYGLWTTETYDRVPWQRIKGLDWITLLRSYLKSGCSSAMHHHSVIKRTVRGPN